jgi:flagellin
MTTINSNISALRAQESVRRANEEMGSAMNRLSTGLRINSAADDAAGSGISSRMETQIRSLAVGVRNANDAISMTQTAEGALGQVENILQRLRELAVQGGNSTLNTSDRTQIQSEVDALMTEIDAISASVNFNGIGLLDGSQASLQFQAGVESSSAITIGLEEVSTSALGLLAETGSSVLTSERAGGTAVTIAAADIKINGLDAFSANTTFTATDNGSEVVAAINSNSNTHGAVATGFNNVDSEAVVSWNMSGGILIENVSINVQSTASDFVDAVNETVAGVTASLNTNGTISLNNTDGDDIVIADGAGTAAEIGFTADTYSGYVSLANLDGTDVILEAGSVENGYGSTAAGEAADVRALGFNQVFGSDNVTGLAVDTNALTIADEIEINDVAIGATVGTSANVKAAAINLLTSSHGVTADASTVANVDVDFVGATLAGLEINGTTVGVTDDTNVADLVVSINAASGLGDIVASVNDLGDLALTSASGVDIDIDDDGSSLVISIQDDQGSSFAVASGAGTALGRITLSSADGGVIKLEDGDSGDGLAKLGLRAQSEAVTASASGISVTSITSATSALDTIDDAIDQVSLFRADFGATENRLNAAINNMTTQATNTEAAKGRIEDADFATETTRLSKSQILSQAATAMLAQANQSKQGLLALLQ